MERCSHHGHLETKQFQGFSFGTLLLFLLERLVLGVHPEVHHPLPAGLHDVVAERALVPAPGVVLALLVDHQQLGVRQRLAADLAEHRLRADVVVTGPENT